MPALTVKKEVQVQAKTVRIHAKCSDCCHTTIVDQDGNDIAEHDGYVPGFMPDEHYGDYIILDIDLDTGKILNWKAPSAEDIEEWIEEHGEPRR